MNLKMAEYDTLVPYDEVYDFQSKNDDLQAYFMTQFNLELENKPKTNKCSKKFDKFFKFANEESFDFNDVNWSGDNSQQIDDGFGTIDAVIENTNVNEENIKEVLLDLDVDYANKKLNRNNLVENRFDNTTVLFEANDYIDDESLIDELCREDTDRLSPYVFNDDNLEAFPKESTLLPSIETAFSNKYNIYSKNKNIDINFQNHTIENQVPQQTGVSIPNVDYYSYPNNIIHNLENQTYILPETPTSCSEFTFEKNGRTISVSESIESDIHSSLHDGNSDTFEDDDLFVNLDEYGICFENDNDFVPEKETAGRENQDFDDSQVSRTCMWEGCYENYSNQNALVEHIEKAHVNTFKGDEFSCIWRDCIRNRKPFNARYKLLIHMRVHSGHKPNRCNHPGCGKAFSRLENLKIHMRSHTGERPYACPAPHCRKAFSNSSDRAKHQRTHFNARPYACGAIGCGKRYTDPSSLRKHVKSHPHLPNVPRTCLPSRTFKKVEQQVPSSPAKLTTLRCIRDKLTVPRLQRL